MFRNRPSFRVGIAEVQEKNMPAPYFFFHPMLGPDRAWSALGWQASPAHGVAAGDLAGCFAGSGVGPLADTLPVVLPIAPEWLMESEFIQKFGAHQAIFILPARTLDDPAALAQGKALRKRGYHLALRIASIEAIRAAPVAAFDHLHFDAAFAQRELSALDLIHIDRAGLRKIAGGVATHEQFAWLAASHFELCDSAFLTTPDPAHAPDPDVTRVKMLKLLSLVAQDADTRQIEEVFREEPKLSYNLLRLVNSVAVGAKTQISSFHQAIAILGRRQLQRWLQLLIYANQFGAGRDPNPLMQLAAARARQMELLCEAAGSPPDIPGLGDAAFMTGIFSLLDVLLNLPMSEVLDALPLQVAIVEALGARAGFLGTLLDALQAGEAGRHEEAAAALAGLGISPASHAMAQTAAFYWASRINLD